MKVFPDDKFEPSAEPSPESCSELGTTGFGNNDAEVLLRAVARLTAECEEKNAQMMSIMKGSAHRMSVIQAEQRELRRQQKRETLARESHERDVMFDMSVLKRTLGDMLPDSGRDMKPSKKERDIVACSESPSLGADSDVAGTQDLSRIVPGAECEVLGKTKVCCSPNSLSEHLGYFHKGEIVKVVKVDPNSRVCVVGDELEGWVSFTERTGERMLSLLPEKKTSSPLAAGTRQSLLRIAPGGLGLELPSDEEEKVADIPNDDAERSKGTCLAVKELLEDHEMLLNARIFDQKTSFGVLERELKSRLARVTLDLGSLGASSKDLRRLVLDQKSKLDACMADVYEQIAKLQPSASDNRFAPKDAQQTVRDMLDRGMASREDMQKVQRSVDELRKAVHSKNQQYYETLEDLQGKVNELQQGVACEKGERIKEIDKIRKALNDQEDTTAHHVLDHENILADLQQGISKIEELLGEKAKGTEAPPTVRDEQPKSCELLHKTLEELIETEKIERISAHEDLVSRWAHCDDLISQEQELLAKEKKERMAQHEDVTRRFAQLDDMICKEKKDACILAELIEKETQERRADHSDLAESQARHDHIIAEEKQERVAGQSKLDHHIEQELMRIDLSISECKTTAEDAQATVLQLQTLLTMEKEERVAAHGDLLERLKQTKDQVHDSQQPTAVEKEEEDWKSKHETLQGLIKSVKEERIAAHDMMRSSLHNVLKHFTEAYKANPSEEQAMPHDGRPKKTLGDILAKYEANKRSGADAATSAAGDDDKAHWGRLVVPPEWGDWRPPEQTLFDDSVLDNL
eukprot:gnl/TRDRNA2_/TRDRNA2_174512_c0_seq1.p1 gnl/TRDRNA2_/TRDRNA2_174512_c0~~gnl/TRDRNA2_/TRDRNA2_174512_c0_seq1.p1  ORF type:complete len:886 (+),score=238.07 gnl/TRDRNA2_/TRDRNA2_174512_c0_seq1:240-2660(+)